MTLPNYPISPYSAELSRHNLEEMIRLVRLLHRLSENPDYQTFLHHFLPETAQHDNYHASVMMAYDFHITPDGCKLIEVNTNAGGLWFAQLCYQANSTHFSTRWQQKILRTFFHEYQLFCQNNAARPQFIVIVDENPQMQFLYPEMQIFGQLFQHAGIRTQIAAPEKIVQRRDGLYIENRKIDLIYNRHCDFYLKTAAMTEIRAAWLEKQVCLTPNPRMYGLLADKRRMMIWSNRNILKKLSLNSQEIALLKKSIPQILSLSDLTPEQAWQTRKQWVFKPDTSYGSRGVYVGDKLTKSKLAELEPHNTLIQQRIPASTTRINDELSFKTDFRLFAYRNQILAISARLYQGQVTNLRTENGGFAKVRLLT